MKSCHICGLNPENHIQICRENIRYLSAVNQTLFPKKCTILEAVMDTYQGKGISYSIFQFVMSTYATQFIDAEKLFGYCIQNRTDNASGERVMSDPLSLVFNEDNTRLLMYYHRTTSCMKMNIQTFFFWQVVL